MIRFTCACAAGTLLGIFALIAQAQPPEPKGAKGFGPPGQQERKILGKFDKDGDGRLNLDERKLARESMKNDRGGFGGFGPKGKGGFNQKAPTPGPKMGPSDASSGGDAGLYDPKVLRTLFLEFESPDWEAELSDFYKSDVDVPATLTVDGKKYPNVGVHFRGASSYFTVGAGWKRSLNISVDFADKKQNLFGYRTLNLLNSHEDASMMSTVLYSHIARQYMPAPKANFVKVVINGEYWGVYASVQQFNKDFLKENYKSDKGARWKVKGSPGGGGGLDYIGDNVEDYKRRYAIKTKDDPKSWQALINLCRVLNQTPIEKLESALRPLIDVDELLWFLALDMSLINGDGYWIRASDYSLYLDEHGKFHVIPHDMNEAFRPAGGPGFGGGGPGGPGDRMMFSPPPGEILPLPLQDMLGLSPEQRQKVEALQKETMEKVRRILTADQSKQFDQLRAGPPPGGPGGFGPPPGGFGPPGGPGGFGRGPGGPPMGGPGSGGVEIDPLHGLNDARKPLRSRVLAVPALKEKYLANVRKIAQDSLDWKKLGPVVAEYRRLIESAVEQDTRKLDGTPAFQRATSDQPTPGGGRDLPIRSFADQRRKYLLSK